MFVIVLLQLVFVFVLLQKHFQHSLYCVQYYIR
jgi:hypothetical protein